jgi:quercetin dioxygenase-like cupin family protein
MATDPGRERGGERGGEEQVDLAADELEALFTEQSDQPYGIEITQDYDPSMKFVVVFPVGEQQGATASSVAYYIIEPGCHSGLHGDNAEEVIFVAEGEGEAFVSGKQVPLETGGFAVMPEGIQHDIYAYGDTELRLLSFFPTPEIVSTFQEMILPMGTQTLSSKPPAPVIQELSMDDLPEGFPIELLGGGTGEAIAPTEPAEGPGEEQEGG